MNTGIFVLILLFGGTTSQSGISSVTQEFNSSSSCEAAKNAMITGAGDMYLRVRVAGCFKK